MEMGVAAGPGGVTACLPLRDKAPDDVPIGIEKADLRNIVVREALLSPRLAEQGVRGEHRRRPMILVAEDWRRTNKRIGLDRHGDLPIAGRGHSRMATAVTAPEAKVRAPTAAIAHGAPKTSVSTPAESAPMA